MTDNDLSKQLRRAIHDPGSIVGARLGPSWGVGNPNYSAEQESVWDWVTRAAVAVAQAQSDQYEATIRLANQNTVTAAAERDTARTNADRLRGLLRGALAAVHAQHVPVRLADCTASTCRRIREELADHV